MLDVTKWKREAGIGKGPRWGFLLYLESHTIQKCNWVVAFSYLPWATCKDVWLFSCTLHVCLFQATQTPCIDSVLETHLRISASLSPVVCGSKSVAVSANDRPWLLPACLRQLVQSASYASALDLLFPHRQQGRRRPTWTSTPCGSMKLMATAVVSEDRNRRTYSIRAWWKSKKDTKKKGGGNDWR